MEVIYLVNLCRKNTNNFNNARKIIKKTNILVKNGVFDTLPRFFFSAPAMGFIAVDSVTSAVVSFST